MTNIRNFAMCGHIDHGKSTLADRIMEICGAVGKDHQEQLLDSLELEREHGITIKLKAIRLQYKPNILRAIPSEARESREVSDKDTFSEVSSRLRSNNKNNVADRELSTVNPEPVEDFVLNLIDTPGHVDFSYEVSRSLASVEGAVLIVDATQGVQAQTLANFNLALEANLTIIPVINKIDLPAAEIVKTEDELAGLGFKKGEIIRVSAKTGEGVQEVIKAIIDRIPPPSSVIASEAKQSKEKIATDSSNPRNDTVIGQAGTRALIFDSSLDPYKGVIATVRMFGGQIKVRDKISLLATGAVAEILQIGYLIPKPTYVDQISSGEVGFIVTNLKDLSKVKVGGTITNPKNPAKSLPGYQEAKPVVFLSFYPTDVNDFPKLKDALAKLSLNDSSLSYLPESSISLGQGFRVGFLGLLHAQITQERLEREYDLDLIATSPSVNFIQDGRTINKPQEFNPAAQNTQEPMAHVTIFAPEKYYGTISNLVHERRGELTNIENLGNLQKIEAKIPLLDLLIGFYDQLKSITSGYGSLDFEVGEYKDADLVKLDILVNHEPVEGLAQIAPKAKAEIIGRKLAEKLKDAIPRQQIPIPIQAAIGGKIIARETVASFRKDVTQKLYGGDVTRKMKLLEKQKKGKKRMRRFGNVDIPQEAFLAVLKI